MNRARLSLLTVVPLVLASVVFADERSPQPEPPVRIEPSGDGSFVYTFPDIKTPRWGPRRMGFGRAIEFFRKVLDEPSFTVDPRTGEATLTRAKKYADLEERIERCAKGNGFMPYWEELVARGSDPETWPAPPIRRVFSGELQGKSPRFVSFEPIGAVGTEAKPRRYRLTVRSRAEAGRRGGGEQLHEYVVEKTGKTYRLRHSYSRPAPPGSKSPAFGVQEYVDVATGQPDRLGRYTVNRLTPHCNGGEMYCLRYREATEPKVAKERPKWSVRWKSDEDLYGVFRLLPVDFDGDGREELVAFRDAHERGTVLVFEIERAAPDGDQ